MSADPLRLLVPDLPTADEILPYLRRADVARWYTNFGPLATELEKALLAALGANPPVKLACVANCTLGLELALAAFDLPQHAVVLLPTLTFVATATAAVRAGCRVMVCDVDSGTWLLTPEIARMAARLHRVDCVIPVAAFGCPVDLHAWTVFSRDLGIPVLIDAASAFGNQEVGPGMTVAFSLHATKSLGAGEGGFLAADVAIADRVRRLSNFGINVPEPLVTVPGTNAKMSEYHAAVGLAALERWPKVADARRRVHATYVALLQERCPEIVLQERPIDGVYSSLTVRLPVGVDPDAVERQLRLTGIETRRWYFPLVHRHPAFHDALKADAMPVATALAGSMIGLPFHSFLTAAQCARVVDDLRAAVRRAGTLN